MARKNRTPKESPAVQSMESAEAAMRLNVIIHMLTTFNDYDGEGDDDTGGYEKSIMREALLEIRDGLLADAKTGGA